MKTYKRRPLEVQAVQVVAPYRGFKHAFPRHHEMKLPSGRISYFHVVDAEGRTRAYPGDWVVKIPQVGGNPQVKIFSEEEFNQEYEDVE